MYILQRFNVSSARRRHSIHYYLLIIFYPLYTELVSYGTYCLPRTLAINTNYIVEGKDKSISLLITFCSMQLSDNPTVRAPLAFCLNRPAHEPSHWSKSSVCVRKDTVVSSSTNQALEGTYHHQRLDDYGHDHANIEND